MKTKIVALFCMIIVIAIALWLPFFKRTEPTTISQEIVQVSNANVSAITNSVSVQQMSVKIQKSGTPQTASSQVWQTNGMDTDARQEQFRTFIENKNKAIEFFGRIIDQDGNPLEGAKVRAEAREWYITPTLGVAAHFPVVDEVSDAAGRFEIHGINGDGFGIGITKDGYDAEPRQHGFGPVGGSYDNPVIFKMWSTNIHEQLITGNKSFEIMPDGRPYFINLTDGTISESGTGDLKVWILYTNQPVRGQLYDWSAGIEVVNGGLLEVPQTAMNSGFFAEPPFAMYSAPQDGYVPSFHLQRQIKGGQRGEIGNRYFYLLLKDGKVYGRMSINLFAPYGDLHPGLVRISYAINPSGSQILR